MVEILRSPSLGQNMPSSPDMMEMTSRFMNTGISTIQEEQTGYAASAEGNFKNSTSRAPRRAFTSTDYQLPASPVSLALQAQRRLITPSTNTSTGTGASASTPRESSSEVVDSYFQIPRQIAIASSPVSPRHASPVSPYPSGKAQAHALPQRLPLPSPQRSYSLMDVEPVPFTHQPGTVLTLPQLPPELHYAIFDFLDPIDSTCLALTSKHFHAIYRQMYGKVSLAARREGPNDMEWVWRNAGPFMPTSGAGKQNSLAMLSPRGQVYCRKCRTQRCELHKHIREWMGEGREYCEVTQKFGPRGAPETPKEFCYRSSPKHPHRCGRHTRPAASASGSSRAPAGPSPPPPSSRGPGEKSSRRPEMGRGKG